MKSLNAPFFFLIFLAAHTALADVRLPNVFGSHMVMQRRKPVPVWGWADAGERVMVTMASQTKTTKAGKDGKWRVDLDAMEAGGPYQMTVKGKKSSVTFDDVLTGEVWVCSGQSNMEWPLKAASNGKTEVPKANYPQIRQLAVKKTVNLNPQENADAIWTVCSPETAGDYTAVGYFFAKHLQQDLNVPIGLINSSWGGTHAETWTSKEAMLANPDLAKAAGKIPIDFDEMRRSGQERIARLINDQQGALPTAAEERTWASPTLNATNWRTMYQPGDWEWQGLPQFDGVVWFRKEIDLPANVDLTDAKLLFINIDDADSTFVNGQFVGSTDSNGVPRNYQLPNGLLKPGRNLIAVRIKDNRGGGGFMGNPDQMKLTANQLNLPLAGTWQYRIAEAFPGSYDAGPNTYGTLLFNAMLNPLIPYAIEGVIWYQGESNAGRASQYRQTFPRMIQDWRKHWGYDFSYLFVQLASYNSDNGNSQRGSTWGELREAQTMTLSLPKTGMAVTSDIGESNDIHPKNKEDVGKRLAAEALRVAYASDAKMVTAPTLDASRGPMFGTLKTEGNRAVLTFEHTGSGLMAKDKYGYVRGFEVAGVDQKFHYAQAEINGNTVTVHASSVATPVAVRYGWADDNGDVNLYNREGFPAVPFRTDSWKGITEGKSF